jgi:hypothetical protein
MDNKKVEQEVIEDLEKIEKLREKGKVGYAYLVSFIMRVRIKKPLKPVQELLIPDSMELIFPFPLPHSGPAVELFTRDKEEEFNRAKLLRPQEGEKEIVYVKATNVYSWGMVEFPEEPKPEDPVN